jgi:hypothetical protein
MIAGGARRPGEAVAPDCVSGGSGGSSWRWLWLWLPSWRGWARRARTSFSATASDIELIVDGQAFATPATVGSIPNTAPVVIGSHPGADWYQGSLDEATISIGS